MTPPDERRATPRFLAKPGGKFTYGMTPADIRDLSLEGVYVLDPDPLPEGSELAFCLIADGTEIELEGIVRLSHDAGMGIEFTRIPAVSKRRLRIYIAGLVPVPSELVAK